MDLLILHSWLKDYLKTSALPEKIAEYLSLCGPSFERINQIGKEKVYSVEVTTNQPDSASVYGIAREAAAILPRFGIKASLLPIKVSAKQTLVKTVPWLHTIIDHNLCSRFTTVLIKNVKIGASPKKIQERLKLCGARPINNIVDISNYLMLELGQPLHTFDYDKIKGARMILRESKKGEKIVTLDNKEHTLAGGDIVIEDEEGRLIDLAGIMGGLNSAVDNTTKNVLAFVQTYNPINIRKTSMSLAQRTDAASLFEKGLDPEQVEITIRRAIDLFVQSCGGKPAKEILDLYQNPYKPKIVSASHEFINQRLGIQLEKKDIKDILNSLGFKTVLQVETLQIEVPSWRANDINTPEDIVEEVARLYGYHNLPSTLMTGSIPDPLPNAPFVFETKVKSILKGYGGVETYTYSMTSLENADLIKKTSWILKLKNPLGEEGEYMRLSLAPSLVQVVKLNPQDNEPLHLFEVANVYPPVRVDLPEEKMMLAGVFARTDYRVAKGVIESLLEELGIEMQWKTEDFTGFVPHTPVSLKSGKENIGRFGKLESGEYYYEFDMTQLQQVAQPIKPFKGMPKYPPQVEDLTFDLPERTLIGEVAENIKKADQQIVEVALVNIYQNSRTFRVYYQNPNKTLSDKEVAEIRKKIIRKIKEKFAGILK